LIKNSPPPSTFFPIVKEEKGEIRLLTGNRGEEVAKKGKSMRMKKW